MRIIRCQHSKTELLETPADLITRTGLTADSYRRRAAGCTIPPAAFQSRGVPLFPPYTSYAILQSPKRIWMYSKAPLPELLDVQALAEVIGVTPAVLVRAVRSGLVPEPDFACQKQYFWVPDFALPAAEAIREGVMEFRPPPKLPKLPPLSHVYAAVGNVLGLDRPEFDVRFLSVKYGYGRWQVDTAAGDYYIAMTDQRGGVQVATPIYIPPDLDP